MKIKTPLTVKAFAKINLGLFITRKRDDGYHTLSTLFAPIDWYDILSFSAADAIEMSCTNPDLPVDDSNLCVRAARLLQDESGVKEGVSMLLDKRVPFGAGLGGGSSDAATVLRVLNSFWDINLSSVDLHRLAVSLGADVPYFLEMQGLAYAGGIGDELVDLNMTIPWFIVTVFPCEHISTAWAYGHFHRRFELERPDLQALARQLSSDGKAELLRLFENDFESAVFEQFGNVRQVKTDLLSAGALFSSLSGSGSAVYGLFEGESAAREVMAAMEAKGYPVSLTPPGFSMRQ
ncbi:4-(cytidine 5'-diphospho)-2-C-methyl-D-erythritol kinase [Chlorobium phaeovibrioides]|uniref:4-(cytidine 5'-diphospho)-2-C-methyl-D-erythritol kinase n=1 Tax=Chlorobium phaeovibrioides TaxID=1094 RepID=UPI001231729B|nr:4-(cytidine 5'-diphospho)-2-C-methyl-D-erythritol kinase [Chlorobium phaeovibrioides]QEQ56651.1 4-(cytidine 5'-diphospho)-2-C-methyl-D-erythritol kinase [Chlorobium phaeovibrioides]